MEWGSTDSGSVASLWTPIPSEAVQVGGGTIGKYVESRHEGGTRVVRGWYAGGTRVVRGWYEGGTRGYDLALSLSLLSLA